MRFRVLLAAALVGLVACGAAFAAADPQLQIDPADQAWAQSILPGSNDLDSTWQALPGDPAADPSFPMDRP